MFLGATALLMLPFAIAVRVYNVGSVALHLSLLAIGVSTVIVGAGGLRYLGETRTPEVRGLFPLRALGVLSLFLVSLLGAVFGSAALTTVCLLALGVATALAQRLLRDRHRELVSAYGEMTPETFALQPDEQRAQQAQRTAEATAVTAREQRAKEEEKKIEELGALCLVCKERLGFDARFVISGTYPRHRGLCDEFYSGGVFPADLRRMVENNLATTKEALATLAAPDWQAHPLNDLKVRARHVHAVGKSGMGKTSLLLALLHNDLVDAPRPPTWFSLPRSARGCG